MLMRGFGATHTLFQMPHYHLTEATRAVKPVLGKYFKEPQKSGILPFHLIKQYFKGARVRILSETERGNLSQAGFLFVCGGIGLNLGYNRSLPMLEILDPDYPFPWSSLVS